MTRLNPELADLLAQALAYPAPGSADAARAAADDLRSDQPSLADALDRLGRWLEEAAGEAEERYTALFDLRAATTLELGAQLCGQSPQRRALLAGLAEELRARGLDGQGELPDLLPNLLRLLSRIEEPSDREALVTSLLLPGLDRLNRALASADDAWPTLLRALPPLLESDYPLANGAILASAIPTPTRPREVPPC